MPARNDALAGGETSAAPAGRLSRPNTNGDAEPDSRQPERGTDRVEPAEGKFVEDRPMMKTAAVALFFPRSNDDDWSGHRHAGLSSVPACRRPVLRPLRGHELEQLAPLW